MLTASQISTMHMKLLFDLSRSEEKALNHLGLCQQPTFKTHHLAPLIDVDIDSMMQLMELLLHQLDQLSDKESFVKEKSVVVATT